MHRFHTLTYLIKTNITLCGNECDCVCQIFNANPMVLVLLTRFHFGTPMVNTKLSVVAWPFFFEDVKIVKRKSKSRVQKSSQVQRSNVQRERDQDLDFAYCIITTPPYFHLCHTIFPPVPTPYFHLCRTIFPPVPPTINF